MRWHASVILFFLLHLEPRHFGACTENFEIGVLRVRTNWTAIEIYDTVRHCFVDDTEGDAKARSAYRHFAAAYGKALPAFIKHVKSDEILFNISHTLNSCASSTYIQSDNPDKLKLVAIEEARKELVLHVALAVMPWNHMAAKNLAYEFEWLAYVNSSIPLSLLTDSRQLLDFVDPGLELQSVFISPTLLKDQFEAFYHHIFILTRAYHIIRGPGGHIEDDPSTKIRELQLNIQYLGISPGILSIAFGAVVNHLFPGISVSLLAAVSSEIEGEYTDKFSLEYEDNYDALIASTNTRWRFFTQNRTSRTQIRLGIVSEHEDNSSPGNCLKKVFSNLAEFTHIDPDTYETRRDFEFIFFAREGSRTVFTATVNRLSQRTYTLDHQQGALAYNRAMIAAERLDILLYIALPTEKTTWFLSQARLAPVQVVFGVGHPLTSGSFNIDYSIVSSEMFQSLDVLTQKPPSLMECFQISEKCAQEMSSSMSKRGSACDMARRSGCAATPFDSRPPSFYSEQLVIMDSLSYFLEEHLNIYDEPVHPLGLSYESSCEEVNERLIKWGFYPNVTAEQLGCVVREGDDSPFSGNIHRTNRSVNIYACIQIQKKMHPSFDPVIAGVLRSDPQAVIMVEAKFRTFFPRLLESANSEYLDKPFTLEELHRRILLVPRLHHFDYQQLISMSSVFLNTFPFGAGITSSEAIATCVPVVVDASRSSVLHLGLAQVRRLGEDFEADLIVNGKVGDYVERAVTIANLDSYQSTTNVRLLPEEETKYGKLYAYRNALCRRKERLLGNDTAAEVAEEWANFLKSIALPHK